MLRKNKMPTYMKGIDAIEKLADLSAVLNYLSRQFISQMAISPDQASEVIGYTSEKLPDNIWKTAEHPCMAFDYTSFVITRTVLDYKWNYWKREAVEVTYKTLVWLRQQMLEGKKKKDGALIFIDHDDSTEKNKGFQAKNSPAKFSRDDGSLVGGFTYLKDVMGQEKLIELIYDNCAIDISHKGRIRGYKRIMAVDHDIAVDLFEKLNGVKFPEYISEAKTIEEAVAYNKAMELAREQLGFDEAARRKIAGGHTYGSAGTRHTNGLMSTINEPGLVAITMSRQVDLFITMYYGGKIIFSDNHEEIDPIFRNLIEKNQVERKEREKNSGLDAILRY